MFIGPFDKIVVTVIARENSFRIGLGDDDATFAHPVDFIITVEPMVPRDQVARTRQNTKMRILTSLALALKPMLTRAATGTACSSEIN